MDGYIINPMWFYWLNVVNGMSIVAFTIAILAGVACIFFVIEWFIEGELTDESKKRLKICGGICIGGMLLAVFIPSESTLIKMKLAEFATEENAEALLKAIQDGTKYILENL